MTNWYEDEARFGRISQTVRCWAPPSNRPTVAKQHIREYLYVYSAVCPWSGENFSLILPYTNSKTMEIFLRELSKFYKEYRIVLVTDNASESLLISISVTISLFNPLSDYIINVDNGQAFFHLKHREI